MVRFGYFLQRGRFEAFFPFPRREAIIELETTTNCGLSIAYVARTFVYPRDLVLGVVVVVAIGLGDISVTARVGGL